MGNGRDLPMHLTSQSCWWYHVLFQYFGCDYKLRSCRNDLAVSGIWNPNSHAQSEVAFYFSVILNFLLQWRDNTMFIQPAIYLSRKVDISEFTSSDPLWLCIQIVLKEMSSLVLIKKKISSVMWIYHYQSNGLRLQLYRLQGIISVQNVVPVMVVFKNETNFRVVLLLPLPSGNHC